MELITGAHQQTVNLRYQRGKDGLYAAFIWRYDSGLVATGVPDLAARNRFDLSVGTDNLMRR